MKPRNGLAGTRHKTRGWSIEDYANYYRWMPGYDREKLFAHNIAIYELERRRSKKNYFKLELKSSSDHCVFLMFWAPEGKTRPHQHVYEGRGSAAAIHVLKGTIVQELFRIGEAQEELLEYNEYFYGYGQEAIQEEPDCVHRIGNKSLSSWAITVHEFTPGFAMRVYDFELNRTWLIAGNEDTLGDPPYDAEPIWPRTN